MKLTTDHRRADHGFTLVELLVVIAIITILATIVTPRVTEFLEKGRVARALTDVKNAETSLNGMLSDANINRFQNLLTPAAQYALRNIDVAQFPHATGTTEPNEHLLNFYEDVFYLLLRVGREAALEDNVAGLRDQLEDIAPAVAGENQAATDPFFFGGTADPNPDPVFERAVINKLQSSYMQISTDPWENAYNFWMGPLDRGSVAAPVFLRSFRLNADDSTQPYIWDTDARTVAREIVEGQPPIDDAAGYPAPTDESVYIWSNGSNALQDAHNLLIEVVDPIYEGGGDDINSWDSEAGWESAPRPE